MDDISFERAPVIEIIAELRWLPAPQPRNALTAGINIVTGPEEFFKRFGSEAGKRGFSQSERLIPIDSGYVWQSAAWRFRPIGDLGSLWQVGLGLFSANALQPYSRWTEFRPTVELGVATLLATRPAEEAMQPFAVINLRYLNAFSGELLGGKTS